MVAADDDHDFDRDEKAPLSSWYALVILTALFSIDFADRYVPSAVKDMYKEELGLSDAESSLPLTVFVLSFVLASPFMGWLADKENISRKIMIAVAAIIWSLATASTALASNLLTFCASRAIVGVAESCFACVSPTLIADLFPRKQRVIAMAAFQIAIPIGAALGFAVGGILGQAYGWRAAFLICGLPGAVAGLLVLLIKDPGRGARDEKSKKRDDAPVVDGGEGAGSNRCTGAMCEAYSEWAHALPILFRNRRFMLQMAGQTALTFAIGAMGDWYPMYYHRHFKVNIETAGLTVGAITVAGGILGTISGGLFANTVCLPRTRNPYFGTSALSLYPAILFLTSSLFTSTYWVACVVIFIGLYFLWWYQGPQNAIIANVLPPLLRSKGYALSNLVMHVLGDAISPPIVGAVSDASGSLRIGLSVLVLALITACAVYTCAWYWLPDEGAGGYTNMDGVSLMDVDADEGSELSGDGVYGALDA